MGRRHPRSNGYGDPLGNRLHSPNWGAHWVRCFSWFHIITIWQRRPATLSMPRNLDRSSGQVTMVQTV
jgi:hypothetical protein